MTTTDSGQQRDDAAVDPDATDGRAVADALSDPDRLAALAASELMDSLPEEAFDRVVRLATRITGTPVGLVSLVDGDRQFFKAQEGLRGCAAESRQTPLSHSFCQYVVATDAPLSVADARADPVLRNNKAIPDLGVIAYLGVPIHDPQGHALGALCAIDTEPHPWSDDELAVLRDLSGVLEAEIALRRVAAERQLLLRELNHRVKNLFAIIGGMIRLSRKAADSAEDLARAVNARVQALAAAHDLIVPVVESDTGHGPTTTLADLLEALLRPYRQDSDNVSVAGPDLLVDARSVTSLALALHELVTNAVKYGALAVPEGQLTVTWQAGPEGVRIDWHETDVADAPTEEPAPGFGATLLQISVESQMGGAIETDYASGGIRHRVTLPAEVASLPDTVQR